MQRLVTLGLLAALGVGGWNYVRGLSPQDVRRAAQAIGGAVSGQSTAPSNGFASGPPPSYGNGYGQVPAATPQAPAGYTPAVGAAGAPTIRIASFNIQTFGKSKASKPYVMRTLAEIIKNFDIVAIQEIRTQDDYFIPNFLRQYVNTDGRTLYDARVSPRLGRTVSTEQYAFVFNTATVNAHPSVMFVMGDGSDMLHREPHVGMFQCRAVPPEQAFTFLLMNVHTDPDEVPQELDALYGAYQAVQRMSIGGLTEDDVILLGDLNTNVPASGPYRKNDRARSLIPADLRSLAQVPGMYAAIRDQATNTRGSRLHDNLLYSRVSTTEVTGRSGVFDIQGRWGLTQEQALQVSDHLPVWAEFSAYESGVLGSAANPARDGVYR